MNILTKQKEKNYKKFKANYLIYINNQTLKNMSSFLQINMKKGF